MTPKTYGRHTKLFCLVHFLRRVLKDASQQRSTEGGV